MFKSYLIIALRNLYKNKLYSLINIIGLGVAMAICVAAYVNYQFGRGIDNFHENAESTFVINSYATRGDQRVDYMFSPTPLAPAVHDDVPGVEKFVRVAVNGGSVRHGDLVFSETFYYVDEDFFKVLTFPLIRGTADVLSDRKSIVITDEIALKYFGNEDPIGKQMVICPDGENEFDFVVRGVIAAPGLQSSIRPTICLPYESQIELYGFNFDNWNDWTSAAFVQINPSTRPDQVEQQLAQYVGRTNEANSGFQVDGFYLTGLPQLAEFSQTNGGPFFSGMHPAAVYAPIIIALMVLLLACFNFINTAVAFAARRLNEIGVRKTLGAVRGQLVRQFIGENMVLCFIALLVAAVLAEIFVPAYDSLWPELALSIDYSQNLDLVGFLVGLLLFTGLAAGAYPALYISSFNPVEIFKGKQKLVGTNPLIRILLTFQLALGMTVIIAAVVFARNAEFIETLDLGYSKENVVVVPIAGQEQYELMKSALEHHPGVVQIGGAAHVVGQGFYNVDAETGEYKTRIFGADVGENYIETMGFEIIEGRSFDINLATDVDGAVVVNESLVREFGWESIENQRLRLAFTDSTLEYAVVGVVKDFLPFGIYTKVRPTLFRMKARDRYRYMVVRMSPGNTAEVSSFIETTWKERFPHRPYSGFWQDEVLAEPAQVNESIRLVFLYIAVLVIIISSMGLFALVSLNISRRTKEIGIRKTLGASVPHICYLIAKEFIMLMLIGGVIASALGYFMLNALMNSIWEYHIGFDAVPFLTALLLVFAVSVVTVGLKVVTAAHANPVEALRYE
jgi:putative ABC transport system permease protein